ncbi:MAG: aminotransferase class I/II-fold pyridoxal phosphate-dependent enzyme [Bacteroidia bacterium]|nr:aminotransferase class I/II-fold pyridoxal phosphate-dependent enzyme [Bacteroidia bacterium]
MAATLIGSEIIKLAGEIKQKIAEGNKIYNFTIGDFDSAIFPIPELLETEIIKAYREGYTTYPPADGEMELRKAVAVFSRKYYDLPVTYESVLIGGGARPMIYSVYATLLDPGDTVVFPVPSWNNNHYCHLVGAKPVFIEALPEDNFMPTAASIEPYITQARLIAVCSPLNPTGTVFSREELEKICDLILAENKRRAGKEKPLYLMYDQIYALLTFKETVHYNPVTLRPEMKDYTLFIDGISKCFAATGVRVGWTIGPDAVISSMKSILSHIGAWAPKAEQIATARFLNEEAALETYIENLKKKVLFRLDGIHNGFQQLRSEGFPVDSISPQAAIYLTIKLELKGKITQEGEVLETARAVTAYILDAAGLAVVPFYAFGADEESPWYRLSVGTCTEDAIQGAIDSLRTALKRLR